MLSVSSRVVIKSIFSAFFIVYVNVISEKIHHCDANVMHCIKIMTIEYFIALGWL